MKKLILLLPAVLPITACGQGTENGREAVYMNITAEKVRRIMDTGKPVRYLEDRKL